MARSQRHWRDRQCCSRAARAAKPSQLASTANLLLVNLECVAVLHVELCVVSDVSSKNLAPHEHIAAAAVNVLCRGCRLV
jgi:hypothetical protein